MAADSYDPLDPNGNITVTFDILKYTIDGYVNLRCYVVNEEVIVLAIVTIQNYYQYRHVENPGWKLGWTWSKSEIIWSMSGAFATQQGNCSSFKYQVLPHSCKPDPVIVDLMPDSVPEKRSYGCCKGGVLAAWAVDRSLSYSSFEVTVGNLEQNSTGYKPLNLTLMAPGPGYTCGQVMDTSPTVSSVIGGRREEQVFRTWKSTCTYSSYLVSKIPICCLSLSTFYNPRITSCPTCSCGCRGANHHATTCIREGVIPSNINDADLIRCTDHMCPLRIHWHIKNNYVTHWRVKLTVSNYNYGRNYSNWNVVVQHPGFGQPSTAYSFNTTMLPSYGVPEDVALFWGKAFNNAELLQGVDSVGTVSASLLTYASIQALEPDLIINAGTAGGFKAKGASISDVFLASDVAFHDRRNPIPVFDLYGVGLRHAFSTPNLAKELNLKVGKLSTGDSLDMTPQDEAVIIANDATVKDMEGAAIAYVADLLKVPAIFLKAVTDIVDGDKPTAEEFLQNLAAVTAALDQAATRVVDFINGKSFLEL
ncbi:hypothetical protein ACJIZ3_015339 [Penstemon smallii]|uniref:Nucleoside phosphorylase domain-containing protein n=1 Tax=Penstemon smallii TaxID=265156 RepID=A0ABD3RQ90_9LAMI